MLNDDPKSHHARNLNLLRSTLAGGIILAVCLPSVFQPFLNRLWTLCLSSTIYTSSICETLLTIGSYAALEAFYTSLAVDPAQPHTRLDQRPGKSHLYRNGTVLIRPYGRRLRELIEYAGPLIALDLTMVKKFKGVPREQIIRSGGYSVAEASGPVGNWARDGLTGVEIKPTWRIPTLHNFSWASPVQLTRALPATAPSSREIVLGLMATLVLYDFYFYLPHVALHKVSWLWKFHVPHHQHSEIHPQVTNQLSITERMTLLTAANIALHTVSAHPLTRTCFVPIFLHLLVENHSGLDLPYGYHKLLPDGWAAGPEEHAEHHRHAKVNFQPYLTWADRLAGTHARGRPNREAAMAAS